MKTGHGVTRIFKLTAQCALPLTLATAAISAFGPVAAAGRQEATIVTAQASPAKPAGGAALPAAQKRATGKGATDAPAAAAGPASDSGLRQRVEALEEQLVDLQVVIGTLESLAKSGGGTAGGAAAPVWRSGGGSAGDQARLDGIETQVRALTAQIEQLSEQVRQGTANGGVGAAAGGSARRPDVAGYRAPETGAIGGFGSTTVTPGVGAGDGEGDAIGGLLSGQPSATPPATRQPAAITPPPAAVSDAAAKQLYETAYGHLLQQDYGAAEAAFDDFLKRFPNDGLAGNAQYWLGESHYVRGQYKAAATAFLKGYQSFGKSAKAPDSLLKLAMSLERLGQKDAACSSFGELATKFPNAPAHVKARAQSERQRIGCS